ncbi:MAG: ATP-grasp domain-containing protein [Pseudomonadota bacterium]
MNVLLLFESDSLALKVAYSLAAMGANIFAVGRAPNSPMRYSRYVQSYAALDFSVSPEGLTQGLSDLKDIIGKGEIEALVPVDVAANAFLAEAGNSLDGVIIFPCSSVNVLVGLDDKWQFARFMAQHGLPHPETIILERIEALDRKELEALGFPFLIKPLRGESGHGMVLVDDLSALERYLSRPNSYNALPLIAQRFVSGRDISLNVLAVDGEVLAWTLYLWETTIGGAGRLETIDHPEVLDIGRKIVKAANYSGVANIDTRLGDDGAITVFECNPRFWYTLSASLWQGVNFVALGIRAAQGDRIGLNDGYRHGPYFLTGELVRRPWHVLPRLTRSNLQSILQVVTDPLPKVLSLGRTAVADHETNRQ